MHQNNRHPLKKNLLDMLQKILFEILCKFLKQKKKYFKILISIFSFILVFQKIQHVHRLSLIMQHINVYLKQHNIDQKKYANEKLKNQNEIEIQLKYIDILLFFIIFENKNNIHLART